MEGFFDVNGPVLQSAGLFDFHLLQAELTTVGTLLDMRKKERSGSNRKKEWNKKKN